MEVYDLVSGKRTGFFPSPTNSFYESYVTPSGHRAIAIAKDYTIYRWDAATKQPLEPPLKILPPV